MLHHTYIHTSKLRSDERGSGITAVGGCVSLVGAHEHLMEVGKPDLPLAFMFRVTGTLGAVVSHESILILGGWGVVVPVHRPDARVQHTSQRGWPEPPVSFHFPDVHR